MPEIDQQQLFILLLAAAVFLAVVGVGGAIILARSSKRKPIADRLEDNNTADLEGTRVSESQPSYWKAMHGIGTTVAPKGVSDNLRKELSQAGIYGRSAPFVFIGIKITFFLAALTISLLLILPLEIAGEIKMVVIAFMSLAGLILPNMYLTMLRKRRQNEVRRHLSDAVDLLEICVGAGMGLDMAWRSVSDQIRRVSAILADEMSLTDLEINLGATRADAMRHMAERTQAEELSSLVTAFLQSERFGTSISETLRAFASSMRETRQAKAEEAAEKMAVKILFPLVVFIFPVIIIVTAGPAAIKIKEAFGI